ncbi:hypothetical protein BP5796_07230 [Coleophoma crateriformis]|uniref:RRM domain-containing protein n=1 Tax=Coleophoma crateriformis TaxID=565419 RepID=A0A3D8RIN3_9HELO|nr:hypothetical protein BP5796_07230 [Coleophoma crateriformis]
MTSTHEHDDDATSVQPTEVQDNGSDAEHSSPGSSFSDAYKEQPDQIQSIQVKVPEPAAEGDDDDDDYAMTFDSEEEQEGQSVYQVVSENLEQEKAAVPVAVPTTEIPSTILSHEPSIADVPLNGPERDSKPTQASPPPSSSSLATAPVSDQPATQPAAQTSPTQSQTQSHPYADVASGGIDIQQLLDNITANAELSAASTVGPTPTPTPVTPSYTSHTLGGTSLTSHASLPPRPQISSYRPPGVPTALVAAGAPGTSSDPRSGLPPPPTASFRSPPLSAPPHFSPALPTSGQDNPRQSVETSDGRDDADKRWSPSVQKIYDKFLSEERGYVAEGLWDRFPNGSRLFIGNLPSEKVTKRDLFHVFHKYGRLAQVSIKQAYGFVQFHDVESCYAALRSEQGTEVRGKKIHLEISKPQRNTRNAQKATSQQPARRSRSPEHQRGSTADRGGRNGQNGGRGSDNYNRAAQPGFDEFGRSLRARDDYRPARSPSPPQGRANYRSRDDYGPSHGRDFYDSRRRSRSNSPSYGQRESARYRKRSPSPSTRQAIEDADLQIPRRDPRDVPDVQIILLDELDRGFVGWVEGELRGRGLKSEVMFLSPRLPVHAVIRRQILEGVHAVSQLDMRAQNSSKIPLQVFDRQGGANNVRFDEYQDLEPRIAAELILRAKNTPAPALAPPTYYSQAQYQPAPSYQQPAPAAALAPAAPDLMNLVGQLDNATLQKLLSALPQQQQQNAPAASANSSIDLAGILGGLQGQQPAQQNYAQPPPVATPYNPGVQSYAAPPPQQAQSAQQVQNIMAQLAKFRQ